jgi:hypothetical protein
MDTHKQPHERTQAIASDRREHRRSRSDFLTLTFLGAEHVPANWSETGALIPDRHRDLQVGDTVTGVATIGAASHRFRFSAEVVRREGPHIAIRFVNLSPALQRELEKASE